MPSRKSGDVWVAPGTIVKFDQCDGIGLVEFKDSGVLCRRRFGSTTWDGLRLRRWPRSGDRVEAVFQDARLLRVRAVAT